MQVSNKSLSQLTVSEEEDSRLFYLSGIFSISLFLIIFFSVLTYSYYKDRVIKVKTKKSSIKVSLIEMPPPPKKVKPKKKKIVKKRTHPKPKPKPKPKPAPKPHQPKPTPKPEPTPKPQAPDIGSLFSNVKTAKIEEEKIEVPKPKVSDEVISRLKSRIQKTETPVQKREENWNSEVGDLEVEEFKFQKKSVRVDYRELEIRSSTLDDSDKGIYNKFFSQVKSFLYNNWHPSNSVAGNSAIVRIIISKEGVLKFYKITIRGKSEEFNRELEKYLASIQNAKVPVDINQDVSFEVKFRAKE